MLVSGIWQSDLVLYTYIYLFRFFPIIVIKRYGVEFPVLYGRTLLIILYLVMCMY